MTNVRFAVNMPISPSSHERASRRMCLLALWALLAMALLAGAGCHRESPESLMDSARQYSAKGDHKAAVVQYKNLIKVDQGNVQARVLLGRALLDSGDPAGAAIELSKALDLKHPDREVLPALTRALLLLGEHRRVATLYGAVELDDKPAQAALKANVASAYAAMGDKSRTEAALKAAFEADPNSIAAGVLKARLVAGADDLAGGMKLAQEIVARDPKTYEAWHLIGELHMVLGPDPAQAEAAFRKSLAIEPANVQAHLALLQLRVRERNIEAARAQAEELRKVLPRHPQMLFVDAQLAFLDRKFERARELSQTLLKVAPNHTGVLTMAGAVEAELNSLVVAESHFAKALQANPVLPLVRRNLAMVYLRQGQATRALNVLEPMLGTGGRDAQARALAAEALLLLGDAAGAEQQFRNAMTLEPDNERFQTAIALTHLASGQPERAFVDLERLTKSSRSNYADLTLISARIKRQEFDLALAAIDSLDKRPETDRAMALNLRGRVQTLRGDLAAARTAFEQALVASPGDFAAVSNLAAVEVREGKPEAAIRRFEAAIAADPRNTMAYVGKAEVMIRNKGTLEQVQPVLEAAIKAGPAEADPRLQLIEFALAQRRFREALPIAQTAAAALPNRPAVLDALGRAQAQTGDRLQALSTFQRAANLDPASSIPHLRMADLYKADGKVGAAIAALKRAVELDPRRVEARAGLVDMLMTNRQTDEALRVAREMQRDKERIDGWMLEAGIHNRTQAADKAVEVLRNALRRFPGNGDVAVRLHQVLNGSGRADEAQRFAGQWIRQHPGDPDFAFELATAAIQRGDLARAEALLRDLVERFPRHPLALNNLAFVLATTGKSGAVAVAERAMATRPDNPAIMDTLALALASEGQAAKALQVQREAVAKLPDDDGLRMNLARIAMRAGDKALARSELERLVAKGPLAPWHAEADRLLKTL